MTSEHKLAGADVSLRAPRIAIKAAQARLTRALLRVDLAARELEQLAKRLDPKGVSNAHDIARSVACQIDPLFQTTKSLARIEQLPETLVLRKRRPKAPTVARRSASGRVA